MNKLLIFFTATVGLLISVVTATKTGIAISAQSKVLSQSKDMIIDYTQALLQGFHFDDINIPIIKWRVTDIRFNTVTMNHEDLDVWMEGDRIKVRMRNAGGSITGKAYTQKGWPRKGEWETTFDFHCDKGGFSKIEFDFGITKQFVDGKTLPQYDFKWANFEFNNDAMRLDVNSQDWAIKTGSFVVNSFKKAYLLALKPILNRGFPRMANMAAAALQNRNRGNVDGGIMQVVIDMLPENNIHIPNGVYMNYEMADDNRARIDNGRMYGYFKGTIEGMPWDQVIHEQQYQQLGDLGLTSNEPFEYQISTQVLNNIYEVILGKNQVAIDVPNAWFNKIQFPIHWDSTNLEDFIPELTDYIGYDVPLSARFKNIGAPRFIFNKQEMKIKFSMSVECWNEDFTEYYLTINYHDLIVDFDMWLEGMTVMTEWFSIEMDRAEVVSDIVDNLERTHANRKITQFFNYAFDMIIPWANEFHPYAVSQFNIPEVFVDLIKIKDLKMAVRDNYFSFTLDPEFIIKATPEERRRHMYVLASKAWGLSLKEDGLKLLKALFFQ